jgi:hypothetical protein
MNLYKLPAKKPIRTAMVIIAAALSAPVLAGAFVGATVNTASAPGPAGQPLHVRAAPGGSQASLGWINDGDNASLGGKCRRYNAAWTSYTNFNLKTLTKSQATPKIHMSRTWCQLQFEPTSNVFKLGWANANFLDLQ